MFTLLMALVLTATANSFHLLDISKIYDNEYKVGANNRKLLPAVIVQHTTLEDLTSNFPSITAYTLGPKSSTSVWIPQSSIENAIHMAQQLSILGWKSWVDMELPKRTMNNDFNDPHLGSQWYIDRLELTQLWSKSSGDHSIRVAVIDSGIDISHPDLHNKLISPYDSFGDDDDPSPNEGEYCWNDLSMIFDSHGTAVAGISVAEANDHGIVGICPDCSLIPIKMLGEGVPALSADIAAFEHAIANDAAVINNSWGYTDATVVPQPLVISIRDALNNTRDGKGSVVVFAAGNDNRSLEEGELCNIEGVLCISAIDSYERPTAYTNFGNDIDIAAPSATVSIAPNDSVTTNFGGTSAAAPVVSGLAGWILSVNPDLTAQEVNSLLIDTAQQSPLITPDENGHHPKYGYGIIQPIQILTTLYPPIEEPNKGGCNVLAVQSVPVKYLQLLGILIGFLWLGRRQ